MNRAILIVICDFLVSAMLTMMTGMVPAHTGGTGVGLDESTTKVLLRELDRQKSELEELRAKLRETVDRLGATPEREAELRRLAAEIAKNQLQQSKLRASLNATPENTGELDAKELQRRLEEEKQERLKLLLELQDRRHDLAVSRDKLADAAGKLTEAAGDLREARRDAAVQRRELARSREALAKTSEALVDVTRENAKVREDKARTEEKLISEQRESDRKSRELSRANESLRQLNASLVKSKGETSALQTKYANLSGQLTVHQQELASEKDKIQRLERQVAVFQLEKMEAQVQRDEMEKTVKAAVTELSAVREKHEAEFQGRVRAQAKLDAAQKMLSENRPRKNDVIKRYGSAIMRVTCQVTEKSLFGGRSGKSVSYYPVVDFGGKTLLVGALNRFAGDEKVALSFKDITAIDFTIASPLGGTVQKLAGGMLLMQSDLRVAAFPVQNKNCTPLKAIYADELAKRGLEDLYLFKRTSFGGSSAKLDGRVSFALDAGKQSMFIRNAGRANNELKAVPGDMILTSEGEFAGIVVASDRIDGVNGARVTIFNGRKDWDFPVVVPLDKLPGESFYSRYAAIMRKLREKVPAAYQQ